MKHAIRIETVTVVVQKVINDKVVAVNTHVVKRVVYQRKDGTEFIRFDNRDCELIKGVALI